MRTIIAALFIISLSLSARADENAYFVMQSSVAASEGSGRIAPRASKVTFQVMGTVAVNTGQVTVLIKGSNDGNSYVQLSSMTLDLSTTQTSTGATLDTGWRYFISTGTVLTGTGARYSVFANSKL